MVKMAPATRPSPTEAVVLAMFSSRIVPLKGRRTAMATTAAGKVAATVRPARMPTYALAAPKATAIRAPRKRALKVNSSMDREAGTNGAKGFFSIGQLMEGGDRQEEYGITRRRTPPMTTAVRVASSGSLCQFSGRPVSVLVSTRKNPGLQRRRRS